MSGRAFGATGCLLLFIIPIELLGSFLDETLTTGKLFAGLGLLLIATPFLVAWWRRI